MLEWPVWQTIGALWVIVNLRANATYWLGRGITFGASRTRFAKVVDGPMMARAEKFTARWGIFAVPLSFLTIGVQTAVNLTAGLTRMPLRRYIPSVMVGGVLWAVLYGTIGLAAFWTALVAASRVGWPLVIGVIVIILAAVWYLRRYKRKHPDRVARVEAMAAGRTVASPAGTPAGPGTSEAAREPDPSTAPVGEPSRARNRVVTSSGPEQG